MAALHHQRGELLRATGRMDPELYRYLWFERIISDLAYKEITGGSVPHVADQVYPNPPTSPSTAASSAGAYTEDHRVRFNRSYRGSSNRR